jgi:outer membrane protein OmpA-like peptidoglycan-associated protein
MTSESDKPIEAAAAAHHRKGSQARIVVTAHTDGAEAQSSSIDPSPERGDGVKRRLTELGVPADKIEVWTYADSRPLVPVAPGTAEPQNRRVELIVQ